MHVHIKRDATYCRKYYVYSLQSCRVDYDSGLTGWEEAQCLVNIEPSLSAMVNKVEAESDPSRSSCHHCGKKDLMR
jgi:hypothetical protein